jgi:hypothetical protein
LVEVEGIREVRKRFVELSDKLENAFYNYGLYSVSGELAGLDYYFGLFMGEGAAIENYAYAWKGDPRRARVILDEFVDYVFPNLPSNRRKKVIEIFNMRHDDRYVAMDYDGILWFCRHIEKDIKVFSNPLIFLEVAEAIFDIEGGTTGEEFWGWDDNYGGSTWAKICRGILKRGSISTTMFVDSCWAMQHNSGIWLDKVAVSDEEKLLYLKGAERDDITHSNITDLLNSNAEGDMERMFRRCLWYDKDLERFRGLIEK